MLTCVIVCHVSHRPSCVCFSRTNYSKPPPLGVFIPLVFVLPGNVRMVLEEKALNQAHTWPQTIIFIVVELKTQVSPFTL